MACFRTYSIIIACDSKGGICRANTILWHLKEDMAFFRKLVIGSDPVVKKNTVIMGGRLMKPFRMVNWGIGISTWMIILGYNVVDKNCSRLQLW
jgi:dihydrofolate reductase